MIVIFGGTTEGKVAAQSLDTAGSPFYYSTRGGTQEIELHNGIMVSGGMDAEEMKKFCNDNDIRIIVDAAHPFASQLRETIRVTATDLKIPVIRYERLFQERDSSIIWCRNYAEAIKKLKKDNITKLLALTGVMTIAKLKPYWSDNRIDCRFRVLERAESLQIATNAGFHKEKLLFFNDNYSSCTQDEIIQEEYTIMRSISPEAIITKESGMSGYFKEKTEAAKKLGIKIYAVMRPTVPDNFITVYGAIGLRLNIEKILEGFFSLRIGLTTGTYATAATKAALRIVLEQNYKIAEAPIAARKSGDIVQEQILLPSGEPLTIETQIVMVTKEEVVCSSVKYSGDDPDITDGCTIESKVSFNKTGEIAFLQGVGVGTVTLPGLGLKVGDPAINIAPRRMMERETLMLLQKFGVNKEKRARRGVNITISVNNGKELAEKTFNPKVGIIGGISIIGTSGVIKPFSKEAFTGSMKKEMEVARAMGVKHIVINSGARSEKQLSTFLHEKYPDNYNKLFISQSFIHYGNFIGEAISLASEIEFEELTLGIMIGKAVKLAAGNLNTHSKNVLVDKEFIKRSAEECGCRKIPENLTLARELWTLFDNEEAEKFFPHLVEKCLNYCRPLYNKGKINIVLIPEESCPNAKFFYR